MDTDTDPRIAVAQDFFAKYFAGDVAGAARLLDKDIVYRAPGRHIAAGVSRGVKQVTEHMSQFLELTNSVDVLQWEDWMSGVNHVAGLAKVHLQRDGLFQTLRVIFLLAMAGGGTITELEVYFRDTSELDRFFA